MKTSISFPLTVVLLAGCLLMVSCTTTYYIVRHADRADDTNETALSEAGLARANELAEVLRSHPPQRIFSTDYLRTRSTAQPTSAATGVPITLYQDVPTLLDTLRRISPRNVLIVGHSESIGAIANGLMGQQVLGEIPYRNYDTLIVVTHNRQNNTKSVEHRRYGVPSP